MITETETPEIAPLPLAPISVETAWDHMAWVNRIILAEPKRLNMASWVSTFKGVALWARYRNDILRKPACGTICCWAGWIVTTAGFDTLFFHNGNSYSGVENQALKIIAGDNTILAYDLREAFGRTRVSVNDSPFRQHELTPGTRAYAREVVKGFRKVMVKHEVYLKALLVSLPSQQ